jgi:phosphatidylserine/phosphatidylglycerophosphate/cardiolipin synthase-like enzyme
MLIFRCTTKFTSLISIFIFLTAACDLLVPTPPIPTEDTTSNWYSVVFSDPTGPGADSQRGGPDAHLVAAIEGARASVDVAIYDFNLWSLREALLDAHRRGVTVRMVVESDNGGGEELQELVEAGIPVKMDNHSGLMHNKFVLIDRFEVWTGSMNFTVNGAYRNDNNLVRVRSSRLAEDYLVEFEEMFLEDQFGERSPSDTPYPVINIDGSRVEVYFSPEDDTAERIIQLVESAQESVYFMAFSFTSDDIAISMLYAADGGVEVVGVFDASQYSSNMGTEFDRLLDAGQNVHLDGSPGFMHHKVIVIDRKIVITGSYNFSASAENRNDENTLILHDPEIATIYIEEFTRVFNQAVE